MDERWRERCQAQRIRVTDGERRAGLYEYGFVLGRDAAGLYPLGGFERHGDVTFYPAQTPNAAEQERLLAAAMGLARTWERTGFLTARFVKQTDGSDFALFALEEERTREVDELLFLRGLEQWGASFAAEGNDAPLLTELVQVGVSAAGKLFTGDTLNDALRQLPDRTALPEWVTG
ncbi:MAG: hypothetical protein LBR76_03925 [Oscillospiraceae bacterium]|jgi:hypothetical protein|nr:hypothetical protein [Oscillospiraceae bacterium]